VRLELVDASCPRSRNCMVVVRDKDDHIGCPTLFMDERDIHLLQEYVAGPSPAV